MLSNSRWIPTHAHCHSDTHTHTQRHTCSYKCILPHRLTFRLLVICLATALWPGTSSSHVLIASMRRLTGQILARLTVILSVRLPVCLSVCLSISYLHYRATVYLVCCSTGKSKSWQLHYAYDTLPAHRHAKPAADIYCQPDRGKKPARVPWCVCVCVCVRPSINLIRQLCVANIDIISSLMLLI